MTTRTKVLAAAASIAVGAVALFEGYSDRPYYDIAGVLTDCYGNTYNVSPTNIRTKQECTKLLNDEIYRVGYILLEDNKDIPVSVLAAGISLVYNIGTTAYSKSTFRKYIIRNEFYNACYEIPKWKYITNPITREKQVSKGLENRRAKEYDMCMEFQNE